MRNVCFKENWCLADDFSFPFGGAATIDGDDAIGLDVVDAVVSVADFAVAVIDVLVVDGLGTPLPLA